MILLTMLIYYFVLARTENPQGLAKVSSIAAHYIAPVLYLAWWTVYARTGTLGLRHVPPMLIVPTVYMALVLALGYVTGRYPYAMLDANRQGDGAVALHGLGLLVLLVLLCLAVVGLDRLQARRAQRRDAPARPIGRQSSSPITAWRKPNTRRLPANGTRLTSRVWPGSKRTAVPAAMSSRQPRALARSNCRAGLVSAKW